MSTQKSKSSSGFSCLSVDQSYSFVPDCKRYKFDSSSLEYISDAKWWFNQHEAGQISSNDKSDIVDASASYIHETEKARADNRLIEDYYAFQSKTDAAFGSEKPLKPPHGHEKCDQDDWQQDLGSMIDDGFRRKPMRKDIEALWLSDANLMDLDASNVLVFERSKELSSDLDSHFIGLKNVEPWWHATEKDDLASLVSRKPPYTVHVGKGSADSMHFSDKVKIDEMARRETELPYVANSSHGDPGSLTDKSVGNMGSRECMNRDSDGTFNTSNGSNTVVADSLDSQQSARSDLSRTQLLEALCHSQTRAREAEKLAQEACDEKAHVVDLFFRQASYLFAYRQWFRILQLETLCFHLRDKELNPFTPLSSRNKGLGLRKNRRRAAQKKTCKHRCHISTCAIAFAVGLGLAGAGLLVGWTIGWLVPSF